MRPASAAGRPALWLLLGLALASVVAAGPLEAQRGRRGGEQDREQLERRIRAQMGRMMRERLGLTEQEATDLAAVVQSFDERRRDLLRAEQATRRRVEALLLEGGGDGAEALDLLNRMAELRAEEAGLFAEEQEALLGVLTPVQVLELHALREQIGRRIRALRGGRRDQGPGRRRGGP